MFLEPLLNMEHKRGWIEIITGSMFSGKTEELIRRIKRAQIANQKVIIFKPYIDNRYSKDEVVSHNYNSMPSVIIKKPIEIFNFLKSEKIIAIDEAQFFDDSILKILEQLAFDGKRVIVAGLDMDFRGEPFGVIPQIMAVAEYVTKVHAICVKCNALATHSHRITQEKNTILVGEKKEYEPLCRKCFFKIQT